jgi:hypothetical protein
MGIADGLIVSGVPASVTKSQARSYVAAQTGRVLTTGESEEVVEACWDFGERLGIDAGIAFAQMCHETNIWRFTGDVEPSQHNPAGIGTIGGGVPGLTFPNWRTGIAAYFVHLLAWCDRLDLAGPLTPNPAVLDPRVPIVELVRAAKGKATTWRSLGGRFAVRREPPPWQEQATMPGNYGEGIERHHAELLKQPKEVSSMAPKIALASGHHNASGGDAFEKAQTGPLCAAVARHCRALGMDVRVVQPDDGIGFIPGILDEVGNTVVRFAQVDGWVADIFLECHTEGEGGIGAFAIFPDDPTTNDAGRDLDVDVRDKLGPAVAKAVAAATGLGVRGNGTLSERGSAVGAAGSRLGIFRTTASLKASTTRLIIEYGAHDKEPDLSIANSPGFADKCGRATAEAFAAFLGHTVDAERRALLTFADTIPLIARGNLTHEGAVNLSEFGGAKAELLVVYQRLVTHRLAGNNFVMLLDTWDALRQGGKVTLNG